VAPFWWYFSGIAMFQSSLFFVGYSLSLAIGIIILFGALSWWRYSRHFGVLGLESRERSFFSVA